jgi:hypothetical protein
MSPFRSSALVCFFATMVLVGHSAVASYMDAPTSKSGQNVSQTSSKGTRLTGENAAATTQVNEIKKTGTSDAYRNDAPASEYVAESIGVVTRIEPQPTNRPAPDFDRPTTTMPEGMGNFLDRSVGTATPGSSNSLTAAPAGDGAMGAAAAGTSQDGLTTATGNQPTGVTSTNGQSASGGIGAIGGAGIGGTGNNP